VTQELSNVEVNGDVEVNGVVGIVGYAEVTWHRVKPGKRQKRRNYIMKSQNKLWTRQKNKRAMIAK